MKNKGFTLVELLAVITVLGIIGLIAIPTVSSVIKDSKEKAKKIQIKEIVESARSWAANNMGEISESETYYLRVQTLLDEGYISNEEIKDPTDSSKNLDECVSIIYSSQYSNYQFTYVECLDSGAN